MKAQILAAVLLLGTSSYSIADDAVIDEVVVVDSAHDWSGVYLGGTVGYGWSDVQTQMYWSQGATSPWFDYDGDGVTAGAIAGANWQHGAVVFGIEGDVSYANIEGRTEFSAISGSGPGGVSFAFGSNPPQDFTTEVQWYGTLRGRLGYAMDRLFIYGTAGLAVGEVESTYFNPNFPQTRTGDSTTQVGYAVGAGAEAAVTNDWSLRLEYLFVDLGEDRHSIETNFPDLDFSIDTDVQIHTVRTALVYNF